jgi:hypothetical protein
VLRRAFLALALGVVVLAPSAGATASRAPTIALSIVHVFRGCHDWMIGSKDVGPVTTVRTKPGARITLRVSCVMDFHVTQTAGPKLALGGARLYAGSTRVLVFRKAGTYRLVARSVQTSEEMGLQTLGPDNVLRLTVRVG